MERELFARVAELQADVDTLQQGFDELRAALHTAIGALDRGVAPDVGLVDAIGDVGRRLEGLRLDIGAVAADTLAREPPGGSLHELRATLGEAAESLAQRQGLRRRREESLSVVDRVLGLTAAAGDADSLGACQGAARRLRERLEQEESPEADLIAEQLVADTHPLSRLLSLVDPDSMLDDETYVAAGDAVAAEFGLPLKIALVRGRIRPAADQPATLPDADMPRPPRAVTAPPPASRRRPVPVLDAPPTQPPAETADGLAGVVGPKARPNIRNLVGDGPRVIGAGHRGPEPGIRRVGATALAARHVEPAVDDDAEADVDEVGDPDVRVDEEAFDTPVGLQAEPTAVAPDHDEMGGAPPTREPVHPIAAASPREALGVAAAHIPVAALTASPLTATDVVFGAGGLPAQQDADPSPHSLVWDLVGQDRIGLASHLAEALADVGTPIIPHVPVALLRAVRLGRAIRSDFGGIAATLGSDAFTLIQHDWSAVAPDARPGVGMLLMAAALRPTLLAPTVGLPALTDPALTWIEALPALHAYGTTIAEYGHQGQPLDAQALKRAKDSAVWADELAQVLREADEFAATARGSRSSYAAATDVWRRWMDPNGLVQRLLQPVRDDETAALETTKSEIRRLSDDGEVDDEIRVADPRAAARRQPIVGRAYEFLRKNLRKALGLAQRWVELHQGRGTDQPSHRHDRAMRLRAKIGGLHAAALAEAHGYEVAGGDLATRASARVLALAIEDIGHLFDPDIPFPIDEDLPTHLLHGELLRVTAIPLDDAWRPVADADSVVCEITATVAEWPDWLTVLKQETEERDHDATERILDYLDAHPAEWEGADPDASRHDRTHDLRDCRRALHEHIDDTERRIEGAVAFGLLQERDREQLVSRVVALRSEADNVTWFEPSHAALRGVLAEIEQRRDVGTAAAAQRLEGDLVRSALDASPESERRIVALLDEGDASTANEYIDMVLRGEELPRSRSDRDPFDEFFIQRFQGILQHLDTQRSSPQATEQRVIQGIEAGTDGSKLPSAQRRQARDLMVAWFAVKRQRIISERHAVDILEGFGFRGIRVTIRKSSAATWLDVTTEPLRNRDQCPVHAYGSSADGRYRILCVWDRPNEEDLLHLVGETSQTAPAMVFYFGHASAKQRRDLARNCRARRKTVAILDDLLVYALCGERGSRLPILFQCTLPFSWLNPYTTTAGVVPPEVFYGRRMELASIQDPMGSCFIYGGRQLGKTALLRDVARTMHEPTEGRVAIWLDLRVEGIGYNKNIDEIWRLVGDNLKLHGVIAKSVKNVSDSERLLKHVEDWLAGDPRRQVLLLLDEADTFLESDGNQEYDRIYGFKGLMDRTNRRFKVVFAGLHNVQRTARGENQPLAHYGEPLRIGPLLDRGEWRSARALIEEPLAAVGYRFASPDLVTRILARTNYYPSLIQLYCSHLIQHVSPARATVFDAGSSPPYVITADHVDEAYQDPNLRKAIRDRFWWTLDLDERYRVIALAIALNSAATPGRNANDGFSVDWIRDEALTFWPQGFRQSSDQHLFRELLDEMVGLGILREVDRDSFALRSPNVALLIGTQQEIERALEESAEREPPVAYQPATFRRAYGPDGDDRRARRSPLTDLQEAELRRRETGLTIIAGTLAAGLGDVERFFRCTAGEASFATIDDAADRVEFGRRLDALNLGQRPPSGTFTILVEPDCPWSEAWLEEANRRLRRLTSRENVVRIAFLADPAATWQLMQSDDLPATLRRANCNTPIGLRPWDDAALRHWLQDAEFGPGDAPGRSRITEGTGNWPILLDRLQSGVLDGSRHWESCLQAVGASLEDVATVDQLLPAFGLDLAIPRRLLDVLAAVGDAGPDDLVSLLDGEQAPEDVDRVLRWADLLGLVTPTGVQRWRPDPVVKRLLDRAGA